MTERTVVVSVAGADPVTRAGIEAELRARAGLVTTRDPAPADGVVLVVCDEVDPAALQTIRSAHAGGRRTVLLAGRVDDTGLLGAVEAGVCGVVRRAQATSEVLASALVAAHDGDGSLPPDLLGRLLAQVGRLQRQVLSPRGLTFRGLTEREVAILRLLAEGHDTAEVGRQLYFSERTVKSVIHDLTTRLELRNRAHAVAYAIREGII